MLKDTNKTLLRMPSINAKFGAVFYFSVLVVSGLLLCATSIAQDEGKLSRDTQAHLLTKLWMETCAVHFSQPDEIRSIAKKYRFTENPPHAKVFNFLSGEKGMVWDVSLGPHAQNVLVLLDNGHSCRVHARRAASWRINETFEKVLQGIKTPGISVDRISETNIEKDGVTLKQIVYFVSRIGVNQGWAFVATTSDSEAASIQATISVDRSLKPEHPDGN